MRDKVINCPSCSAKVPYSAADVGKSVNCPGCGAAIMVVGVPEQKEDMVGLTCPSCGGSIKMVPGVAKLTCEFCGSSFLMPSVLRAEREAAAFECPKFLAPFAVDEKGVLTKLVEWLKGGVFTPGDADETSKLIKLDGRYLPTYIFECDAESRWSGEYSTSHTRPVTRTRYNAATRAHETYTDYEEYKEWHPTSGVHSGHYRTAVSGDITALPQADLDSVSADPARYSGDEGAGPLASADPGRYDVVQPSISPEDAWGRARARVEGFEQDACGREVERLRSCNTAVSNMKARLVFQPFWNLVYLYRGKKFNALMDGRTGGVAGKRPVSRTKVVIAIILIVIAVILLIACIICLTGGYLVTEGAGAGLTAFLQAAASRLIAGF